MEHNRLKNEIKNDCADVTLLKRKIEIYVNLEEYEKAAKLKKWIEEIKQVKNFYK